MPNHYFQSFILILAGVVTLFGCDRTLQIEGLTKVSGTVTYQGEPIEGATVTFSPADETGRAASGRTDSKGRFNLTTLNHSDGIMAGHYKVAISKTEVGSELMTSEEQAAYFNKHGRAPVITTTDLLPEKYKKPDTSELAREVVADQTNDFLFELE
ncbi:MAG: carboxypeptidase-like regulatory domain-containing protein [Pirellulaceae bacterium]